jgi:hypothetical protein
MSSKKWLNGVMDILAFITPFLGMAVDEYNKKNDREEIARQVAERLIRERKSYDWKEK